MGPFTKTKARTGFIKINGLWYPIDFYAMVDHHLLQKPLKQFMQTRQGEENYDFFNFN